MDLSSLMPLAVPVQTGFRVIHNLPVRYIVF